VSSAASGPPNRRQRWHLTTANRYGLVLVLILITYVVSVATDDRVGAVVVVLIQLATVWIAFTVSESRRIRHVATVGFCIVLAVAVLGGAVGFTAENSNAVTGIIYSVNAVLYLLAPVLILIHLVKRRTIDLQTFLGAIAAYLLLGMMFAFTYRAIGELQAGPFFGPAGDGTTADDLFFSFITLTTTGYGNLVPKDNPGESLAVLEAITGQLFLVTAVAKIVTGWNPGLGQQFRRPEPPEGDTGRVGP